MTKYPLDWTRKITNGTGSDLAKDEWFVYGNMLGNAIAAIEDGEEGCVDFHPARIIETSQIAQDEAIAADEAVYWNPTTKIFTTDADAGNFLVGDAFTAEYDNVEDTPTKTIQIYMYVGVLGEAVPAV